MAPKKTVAVAADNLVQLGAERLAEFLLELADEQPAIKRRLRFELAGEAGGEMIAAEMTKRITTLRSARSFVDWQKRADFVRDLDLTRTTIVERVGQLRPDLALDLMWRFMALAEPVINRVDDSNGAVGAVFHSACEDLGALAVKAKPNPAVLAEHVFAAVTKNDYGEFDGLIPVIFPALGKPGITALKARLIAAMPKRAATDRYDSRAASVRRGLQDLADGEGDVDAYIALVPGKDRTRPDLTAEIGRRLLDAGRAKEAVAALEVATPSKRTTRSDLDDDDLYGPGWEGPDTEWESVYVDALDATGQVEHAQRLRWAAFEGKGRGTVEGSQSLSVVKLARAGYLSGVTLGGWHWTRGGRDDRFGPDHGRTGRYHPRLSHPIIRRGLAVRSPASADPLDSLSLRR